MFQRLLFSVCVLLTVASLGAMELSEKSRLVVHQSRHSDQVVYFDYKFCLRRAIHSVGPCRGNNPFFYFRPFLENHGILSDELTEDDIREFCSIVQSGYECMKQAIIRCVRVNYPWYDEVVQTIHRVSVELDYVCVQHVDVFNRNKACLFRELETGSRRNFPVFSIIFEACGNLAPSLALTGGPRGFCNHDELRECAKDAVLAQCGVEVADALSGLADILGEAVSCSDSRVREMSKTRKHFQGFSPSKESWVED